MKTERETISILREDIERHRDKLKTLDLELRCGLLTDLAGGVPNELQRLASALMVLASDVREAQRVAAHEHRCAVVAV